ncbi:MAG: methyltransferase [Acidimicrobiia bacterium]|jgi:phospholipid N-methyltransferase
MNEHLAMLGRFVRSPRTVGAVTPSSRALILEMLEGLDLTGDASIVELGPGTGVVTREIAARLGHDARCLAIELDAGFARALAGRLRGIDVVCGSAAELPNIAREHGYSRIDHIVSGLPFASLPAAVTAQVLDGIAEVLPPGGTFTTFQYVHGFPMPLATTFRRELSARLGTGPERRLVMRNLPPAYVLSWSRG